MSSITSAYEWRNMSFVDKLKYSYQAILLSYHQLIRLGAVLFVFGGLSTILLSIFGQMRNQAVAILLGLVPAIVIILSVATVFSAVIITLRETIETGKTPPWIVSLREGMKRFGAVALSTIVYGLCIAAMIFVVESIIARIGLSLFMLSSSDDMYVDDLLNLAYVPSIFMWTILHGYIGLYLYAVILQNRSGLQSIWYSYELVRGRWLIVWFQSIALLILFYLVDGWILSAVDYLFADLDLIFDDSVISGLLDIVFSLLENFLYVLYLLFYIVFQTVQFIALRDARKHRLTIDAGVAKDL